ncbi:MAG: heme-binding protein [Verrucomicrobia bacterium]|nr:heme-binding protein [Verrucomicrobiota bacterium]
MKNLLRLALVVAALCGGLFLSPARAQLAAKKALTLEAARKLAAAAEAEAARNKWTMAIAIVDDGGNLVYFSKMDGTQIGSIDVALGKAKTSIRFKRPTKAFEDAILKDGRSVIMTLPDVVTVEGGLPLVVDGVPIGAIGISGGTSAQDGVVAKVAADLLAKM